MTFQKGNQFGMENRGRKVSDETRERLRLSHLGYVMSEDQRQKIREAQIRIGNRPPLPVEGETHWNYKGGPSKESEAARKKRYQQSHPEKVSFYAKQYSRRKRGAQGAHTLEEWQALKLRYDNSCLCCGKSEPEVRIEADHIIPISLGGSNSLDNIQPLCRSCNAKKNIKTTSYVVYSIY